MKITNRLIIKTLVLFLTLLTFSCQNVENDFSDFKYTTTYFAWQYPVRTLVLGESLYYDNTNDLNHRFEIKASVGGLYKNNQNRRVTFEVDQTLVDGLYLWDGTDTVKVAMLPNNYYNALNTNDLLIPSGSFNGGITIQLTDAFFADPYSCEKKYVLPLRIINSQTDSILKGKPQQSALPSIISSVAQKWGIDPRINTDWMILPRNFTIFAINYVNKFHGKYLKRGVETNESIVPNQTKGYGWENGYIEKSTYVPLLKTISLNKLLYADMLAISKLNFRAILEVNGNVVSITSESANASVQVNGTGVFTNDKEKWGGKKRMAFYLDYSVTNSLTNKSYKIKDTLVIRDNAVSVQEFTPIVKL
ncbi:MAG: DUF5627 domain-containing protein [Paludibacter sp.]|nr:DUF5627 domain-containing protein [Paludibacter sp.]